eukprot:12281003-Alexandrium_andersonii.AAC.1
MLSPGGDRSHGHPPKWRLPRVGGVLGGSKGAVAPQGKQGGPGGKQETAVSHLKRVEALFCFCRYAFGAGRRRSASADSESAPHTHLPKSTSTGARQL